jgi:regulator of replication initiation timing
MFWKFFMGNIDRIDFVPIMKQSKDPNKEPFEDTNFWQAFIYVRPGTNWASIVTDAIESNGSYKFFPNQETAYAHFSVQQPNPKEYWVILKNNNPVPYAQTHLNVHQLAHNNSLLETKVSDMEAKVSDMEAKVLEMEQEMLQMKSKMEDMKQDVARLQYDNDTMSMQLSEAVGRTRSDSHSTTESEAESFVNSLENILRMAEDQQGIYRDENGYPIDQMYSGDKYEDDNDGREREEDLVYDDSGEMTPRGRVIKKEDNCHNYAMLDIDGYNNGDVAPRGWKVSIEDDGETSPRGDYEDDGESSPRFDYEDDGESSPRRYRSAEGSLGCNCSDNEE